MAAENEITIRCIPVGATTSITGVVGDNEVITISNRATGQWHVSASACLPVDIAEAAAYLECMARTFERARAHGAPVMARG